MVENHPPSLGPEELELVQSALTTGWVSYAGRFVTEFEVAVAAATGFSCAVSLASGTCALQIALELLAAPGCEIFVPALTFVAPASTVVRAGMVPVFVDLCPASWQLDLDQLERFIAEHCRRAPDGGLINRGSGRRIAGLCLVHLWGDLADIARAGALAAEHGLFVVHDAAQAVGAGIAGQPLGRAVAAAQGRAIAATSFNANKIVTTGAGGALLTNDAALAGEARHLASTAKATPDQFIHDRCGVNYRMSNLNAAVGVAQIRKLPSFVARKRRIRELYRSLLAEAGARIEWASALPGVDANYWSSCVVLDRPAAPVIAALCQRGIQARPVWVPLPRLAIYRDYERASHCDVADRIHDRGVMLPSGPGLGDEDIRRVTAELRELLR
jgi:dTDP-4-amino-4,6-dideoxygalactose transaminase